MSFKIEGNKLIITFDPDSRTQSKSGKTFMLGSSGGFQWVDDGKGGMVGVSYNIVRQKE